MTGHDQHTDPLAADIAKRLAKEQFKPTKKKPEKAFNLQQKLMLLIALAVILGIVISVVSVWR